jgi:hypothetical protein
LNILALGTLEHRTLNAELRRRGEALAADPPPIYDPARLGTKAIDGEWFAGAGMRSRR